MVDRLADWRESVDRSCRFFQLSQDEITRIKAAMLLPHTRTRKSEFATLAPVVSTSIEELSNLIRSHQKGYLSLSVYSEAEKDQLETEVGLFVKTIGQHIERLKLSVLEAQKQKSITNNQAAAHLHGIVLVLAESLQETTAVFDGFRVQRYERKKEDQARKKLSVQAPHQILKKESWSASNQSAGKPQKTFTGNSQQQQVLMEENLSLVTHLSKTEQSVSSIEQSALEISTLNQLFSTAVSSQTAAIEAIYNNAIEATEYVKSGNEDLGQAIKINKSTQYYVVILLVVATLCLLLLDWFNS